MEIMQDGKLWWVISALCLGLLLSSLESTIVATALVSIGSDFEDYERSNWVVVIYLVTYSGFLIIFARLSDTTGRRAALLAGLSFFTIASLACGLARSLTQLWEPWIIFRAFQGLGAAGIYALTLVVVAEVTPLKKFGIVSGLLGIVFALASAIGPVVGGAITSNTTWRWCFYFNVPSGALVILMVIVLFPPESRSPTEGTVKPFARVDWLGCVLSLTASVATVVPLEAGGSQFAWDSAFTIAFLTAAGLLWVAFAIWEIWLTHSRSSVAPLLPMHVAIHRVISACILTAMLTGMSFTGTIIYLPQRFQVAYGLPPVSAGIRMLPLVIVSALATSVAGIILSKKNICSYFIIIGNGLQVLGLGLMSSLRSSETVDNAGYGYQAIVGIGFGTTLSSCVILARIEVRREDIAPLMGAITQLRVFGSVIGVALCRVVLSSYLKGALSQTLSSDVLSLVMSNVAAVATLPPNGRLIVRQAYGRGFAAQSRVLTYIAAANFVVALFTFRRHAKDLRQPNSSDSEREEVTVKHEGTTK